MLKGLEPPSADVGGGLAQAAVGGRREVPGAAFALAARLDQARLDQTLEPAACLCFGLLNESSGVRTRELAFQPEMVEDEQIIERERIRSA